jgi:hypothetical protein
MKKKKAPSSGDEGAFFVAHVYLITVLAVQR